MNLWQEGYKLHYRHMVAQLRINKEMCIFHSCFHYFFHPPQAYVCDEECVQVTERTCVV